VSRRKTIADILMPPKKRARERRKDEAAAITFTECFDTVFADWFAAPTWAPWRVVGKAIFGEPMSPADLAVFQEFTARTIAPTAPAREVWLAVGRRGGKDWFASSVVVYLACFKRHDLKVGDLGRVLLLAVDQDQASECFRYIRELIRSIPALENMVESESTKVGLLRINLNNKIQIMVKAADKRRVRGRTLLAVVLDEVAYWWSNEDAANPDSEVLAAVKPGMLGIANALIIGISSTYARKGLLWQKFKKHFGVDGDRILFWKATTTDMRPSTDPEFLEFLADAERDDPAGYAAEYKSEFRLDLEDFLSIEQVESVTVTGRAMLSYEEGVKRHAFADPAGGGGQDSLAVCIAQSQNGIASVCDLFEKRPPFDAVETAKEVAAFLKGYKITTLRGDAYSGATWASLFQQNGLTYTVEEKSKSDLYHALLPLITGKKVELLDPETGTTAERAIKQLLALERRPSRQGKDSISHPKGGTDDVANAMAGALVMAGVRKPSGAEVASHCQSWLPRQMTRPRSDRTAPWQVGGQVYAAPWERD